MQEYAYEGEDGQHSYWSPEKLPCHVCKYKDNMNIFQVNK
jgi:hypothetical protein